MWEESKMEYTQCQSEPVLQINIKHNAGDGED